MDTSEGLRRTIGASPLLSRYAPGDSLAAATFARASIAAYSRQVSDTLARYVAGGSLAGATIARASVATFSGNA